MYTLKAEEVIRDDNKFNESRASFTHQHRRALMDHGERRVKRNVVRVYILALVTLWTVAKGIVAT